MADKNTQIAYWITSRYLLFTPLFTAVLLFASIGELLGGVLQINGLQIAQTGTQIQALETESLLSVESVSWNDDDELFGPGGGYVHPYLGIGFEFTDNLYNINDKIPVVEITEPDGSTVFQRAIDNPAGTPVGQVSNILTRVTPGIWFSLPRTRQVPITINTWNTAPGGLRYPLNEFEASDGFQAFGLLELDFNMYSADSALNDTDGRAEGFLRYNMRSGLSLQLLDGLTRGQDQLEIGSLYRNDLRRFTSNLFVATADYDMTEKFRLKLDYTNFMLDYDDEINDEFNRTDNAIDVYGFYKYSLKTSLFIESSFMNVKYTTAEEKNNQQYSLYGGIKWDTTEKLALNAKLGSQTRDYVDETVAGTYDWSGLAYEFQALYRWTVKTDFALGLYGRSEESNSALAPDMQVWGINFGYRQQFTDRLSGILSFIYDNYTYNQIDDLTRDDHRYLVRPGLQYQFRDWVRAELAYQYDKRDSNENLFDYTTNTVILNIKFAL